VSVDGLGNPLRFLLTAGQRHDITEAEALVEGFLEQADYLIADRSYDAKDFVEHVVDHGTEPVIPSHSKRKEQREYDKHLYKERHLVECLINKMKHFRRVFSRYEKLASRYPGFLNLAGALIWLR
jgi:transposase